MFAASLPTRPCRNHLECSTVQNEPRRQDEVGGVEEAVVAEAVEEEVEVEADDNLVCGHY